MNITITTIPHKDQLYETTGNWWFDDDMNLIIQISDMGNVQSEFLIAVHEAIEAMICLDRGIFEEEVSEFDIAHPELEDPGDDSRAPYHKEHNVAVAIEMLLCDQFDMDWNDHNKRSEDLYPE